MRPNDVPLNEKLVAALAKYKESQRLDGLVDVKTEQTLIEQIIESTRRVRYIHVMQTRDVAPLRTDPTSELFDPVKAAIWHRNAGDVDEAFWLTFIFTHFGKHHRNGYQLARDVYGGLGIRTWRWPEINVDPLAFQKWLAANQEAISAKGGRFGNHRKYTSLDAEKPTGTGAAFRSYVAWVNRYGSHNGLVQASRDATNGSPKEMFEWLYQGMDDVISFGRTAKFDYLAMVGKLGLAPIEPGRAYLSGATGPLAGARLLFGNNRNSSISPEILEAHLAKMGESLGLGMQVIEDALCNWQKSPSEFRAFRG